MKIVLLLILLLPVLIFQTFMCREVILDYKAKNKAKKTRAKSKPGIQKNRVYYRVK